MTEGSATDRGWVTMGALGTCVRRILTGGLAVWSALSRPMLCGMDGDGAGKGGGGPRSVAEGLALAAVLCHFGPAGTGAKKWLFWKMTLDRMECQNKCFSSVLSSWWPVLALGKSQNALKMGCFGRKSESKML